MPTRREPIALTATASVVAVFAWRTQVGSASLGLVPVADPGLPLLKLPPDFSYVSYGWRRDPMDEGKGVPGLHGGMWACIKNDGKAILVGDWVFANIQIPGSPSRSPILGTTS